MRLRIALVGCAVAVALAGCSGGGSNPAATTTAAGWVRTDLRPVSQPYVAGGHFVVYVQGRAGLDVVGLDPNTGRTAWKLDASASGVTQGVAPIFAIDGNRVVFLRDVGKGSAAL